MTIMIPDLNKIRSLKTLEEMKKDLTDFLSIDPVVMVDVYNDENWGEEDYEADKEEVTELLDRVEHRIKSLGHHLNKKPKVKVRASVDRNSHGQSCVAESPTSSPTA